MTNNFTDPCTQITSNKTVVIENNWINWFKLQYIGSEIKWHDKYLQKIQPRNSGWESITIFCQEVNIRSGIVTRHIRPLSFIVVSHALSWSQPRGMSATDVKTNVLKTWFKETVALIIIRFSLEHAHNFRLCLHYAGLRDRLDSVWNKTESEESNHMQWVMGMPLLFFGGVFLNVTRV